MSRPGLHWFLPNCDNFATRCPVSGPWLIRPPGCPLPPGLGGLRSNYQLHMPGAWCAWSRETNLGSRAENFFQGFDPICREREIERSTTVKKHMWKTCFSDLESKTWRCLGGEIDMEIIRNIEVSTNTQIPLKLCVCVPACVCMCVYIYTWTNCIHVSLSMSGLGTWWVEAGNVAQGAYAMNLKPFRRWYNPQGSSRSD